MTASENPYVARLREAVTTLREVRAERDALLAAAVEPIAVIGLGCRFPGGASGPEAFWRALESGVDAVSEIPAERWPASAIPGNKPESRWASLLDRVDGLDAAFFGISPREAESLDPQQRLLLEVAWEAIEEAGQLPEKLVGSATGVFIGICSMDYQHRLLLQNASQLDAYCLTGNMVSTAAGRISYALGLQGPCLSVDTACSSSLVSMTLACQSLRVGESDLALAGGVNLVLSPFTMTLATETQALSPDGRCRTFDARANGFVRGEGCGMVVLKRLSDAQRDGDRIRAVIRGWAVNQDGRSSGLTAPNVLSQQALLRQALRQARVGPEAIGYVEMHGTGTPLGDPIEADALREVLGKPRSDGSSCLLGAVKTNLGHLEAAAGVAGLIKTVLALEHEQIPANLHFKRLNPRISFDGTPFVIPTVSTAWKRGPKPRIAGVSGFGISGTNAHVVLEEAPFEAIAERAEASSYLLPLSAKSPAALRALARSYELQLADPVVAAKLSDLAYTASARRTHHEHRLAVTGRSREELIAALRSVTIQEGGLESGAPASPRESGAPKVVFVFPGQGSQWSGMGRQLLREEPAFRLAFEACDAVISREAGFSVLAQIAADEGSSRLGEIDVVQPLLFAVEVALAALWRSWGVEPDCVIGHSMGEVAAATVVGALSLDDAARVICRRSSLLRRVSGRGAMGLVELGRAETEQAIAGHEDRLSVAVCNGPRSTVISGDPASLDEVLAGLEKRGVFCRRVKVDVASHSPQMDPLRADLLAALGDIQPTTAPIAMRSTVTGALVKGSELDASYWVKNLREPVVFSSAVQALMNEGRVLFIELSPHAILLPAIEENLRDKNHPGAAIASLRRNADERGALLEALGSLYVAGFDVAWHRLFPGGGRCVSLPSYPWQRERHWIDIDPAASAAPRGSGTRRGGHPLLGEAFSPADRPGAHYWEHSLSASALPYLADHRVRNEAVFPGSAYVEMAISAGAELYGEGGFLLEKFSFERMLSLPDGGERRVQIALRDDGARVLVEISSHDEEVKAWTRHARGTLRDVVVDLPETWESPRRVQERCRTVIDGTSHYAQMTARQILYGPCFRGVETIWLGDAEALGRVRLPQPAGDSSAYRLHPALLDACFQIAAALFGSDAPDVTFVPVEIDQLRLHERLPDAVWVKVSRAGPIATSDGFPAVNIVITGDDGKPLVEVHRLRVRALARATIADPFAGCAYTIAWRSREIAAETKEPAALPPGLWLVFIDESGTGASVAAALRERGESCVEVTAGSRFECRSPLRYTIEPARHEDYQRLFREVFRGDSACRGVVHFWSLDAAPWEGTTPETLLADVRRGSVSTLLLMQELVWQGFRDAPRLVLVTRGAQQVTGDASLTAVAQAPLWGLGRTIAMEQPDLTCTRIDLAPTRRPHEASLILRELFHADGEDQIALRDDGRLVARLEQGDLEPTESPTFSAQATYLITGGLGGLGLSIAAWLIAQGARHLVLVGRSEPSKAALQAIDSLEASGAEVCALRADVSRAADVESVLAHIERRLPALRGIIHAAAVVEDRTLQEMGEDVFWRPIRPKVLGAWNLHAATRALPLDFFVMYSSAAALLGSPGQGNYAAANAFLDALAHRRIALGLPATSIQWGTFSEVGLAAAQENRGERLSHRGIESFTPDDGTALLSRLLARPRAEIGLLRMSVRQWIEFYPRSGAAPFLRELREEQGRAGVVKLTGRFREALESTPPSERRAALERHVLECLSRVLRLPAERIDTHAPFRGYGMDSLMSLEIRNRLEPSLGLKLSAALLYTYPTVSALVDHLLIELDLETAWASSGAASSQTTDALDHGLSEEAAAALLDEKLLDLEDYLR